jgi:hypothetical protein
VRFEGISGIAGRVGCFRTLEKDCPFLTLALLSSLHRKPSAVATRPRAPDPPPPAARPQTPKKAAPPATKVASPKASRRFHQV